VTAVTAAPTYRCLGCGAQWGYEAVRYVACCPECGSGLLRVTEPARRRVFRCTADGAAAGDRARG
jgi:Zn finger protein HypA/HybF involved in hydrogenase expression